MEVGNTSQSAEAMAFILYAKSIPEGKDKEGEVARMRL